MRWLFATLGLLAATAGLAAWIYLRDRNPNAWHPPESQLARYDAQTVLAATQEWPCGSTCFITRLRPEGASQRWFLRIKFPWGPRCSEFDPQTFAFIHGQLVGVRSVPCVPRGTPARAG